MSTDKSSDKEKKEIKIWTPKFETKKEENHYEWKIYIPNVSSRSVDITLESEKKCILVTGLKEVTASDEIYRRIYGLDIPEGEFHLEIPLPEEELDFESYRLHFMNGILTIFVPIKGEPEHKNRILLKKGTPLTSDLSKNEASRSKKGISIYPFSLIDDIFDPGFFF